MELDIRARLARARLSLVASLPWMPPPSGTTTTTTTVPSDTLALISKASAALAARQALEDEMMAQTEEMLAQPIPEDQSWAKVGLTILIVLLLLSDDDEEGRGLVGWLPRWRRRRKEGDPLEPSAKELAEALRPYVSSHATAEFNARQHSALQSAAPRDPRLRMMWICRLDGRVRPSHRAAHGQTQPVGGMFRVGTALLPYPGWPSGPPSECVGCRCVLIPSRAGA